MDSQGNLEKKLAENKIRYPYIKDFKWRVDVTLSTNSMQRVLKPSILMEIVTSEGKTRTFEVSVEKYQELRYQVARTLKDFQELDKLQILKLQ